MKRILVLMLSFTLLLTVITGCGSDQTAKQTEDGENFTYAMSGTYKPFNYKENGELVGFDVEIAEAIAEKMGYEGTPKVTPWETILEGLKIGKYDAIIGSMAITEERSKQVDFSRPYYRSGAQIFVMNDNSEINSVEDLKGKKIGVVKSSTFGDVAREYSDQVKEYASDVIALQDLPTGRIDAVITDQIVGLVAKQENGLEIKEVGEPLWVDEMAIPVEKGNKELLEKINIALEEIIEDGTYDKISEKWFGKSILGE